MMLSWRQVSTSSLTAWVTCQPTAWTRILRAQDGNETSLRQAVSTTNPRPPKHRATKGAGRPRR